MREYICPIPQGTEFHIKMAPILREEIIRCCDCEFFDSAIECGYCNEMRDEDGDPVFVGDGNGFCAWAERVD